MNLEEARMIARQCTGTDRIEQFERYVSNVQKALSFLQSQDHYTINSDDVGKSYIIAFGQRWPTMDFLGFMVLDIDVGKRVYLKSTNDSKGTFLQVDHYARD